MSSVCDIYLLSKNAGDQRHQDDNNNKKKRIRFQFGSSMTAELVHNVKVNVQPLIYTSG